MKDRATLSLLLLFCTLAFLSCNREASGPSFSIEEMSSYWEGNYDQKRLFQLRMAFAKTVARAFGDRDFARHFKDTYCQATDNHFGELFFGLRRDEVVGSTGKTIYQHLLANLDAEARDLFGEDLLDLVLRYDPCVVIKLPDVFRTFEWDVDKVRPAVIAQWPFVSFPNDILGGGPRRFLAYHFSGKQAAVYYLFDLFHVAVKYSEDYMLLDPQSLLNEKAISVYEFLPQAETCDNGMRDDIVALGTPHTFHSGMLVVPKMEAFYHWRDKCGYQGKYWSRDPACTEPCKRKCIPLSESVLLVDSFCVFLGRIFEIDHNYYLEESYTYSWTFWSRINPNYFYRIAIPSLPHEWFDTRTFEVALRTNSLQAMPEIHYQATEKMQGRVFPLAAVLMEEVGLDEVLSISVDVLVYAEREVEYLIAHPQHSKTTPVKPSQLYPFALNYALGCFTEGKVSSGGTWSLMSY